MSDNYAPLLWNALQETLYMLLWSSVIAVFLGACLGILLVITEKGGICPAPLFNAIAGALINTLRSLPFIILIILLLPLSRLMVGTTLGPTAAIVSLSIGASPFLARIIENSLKEVAGGKLDAAKAMGASPLTIIFRVLIPEALPALVRGMTIAVIGIMEFTAIAGAIGGGGLGSLAIRFGYQRYRLDILLLTIAVIVALVQIIQWSGDLTARSIIRRRYKQE